MSINRQWLLAFRHAVFMHWAVWLSAQGDPFRSHNAHSSPSISADLTREGPQQDLVISSVNTETWDGIIRKDHRLGEQ